MENRRELFHHFFFRISFFQSIFADYIFLPPIFADCLGVVKKTLSIMSVFATTTTTTQPQPQPQMKNQPNVTAYGDGACAYGYYAKYTKEPKGDKEPKGGKKRKVVLDAVGLNSSQQGVPVRTGGCTKKTQEFKTLPEIHIEADKVTGNFIGGCYTVNHMGAPTTTSPETCVTFNGGLNGGLTVIITSDGKTMVTTPGGKPDDSVISNLSSPTETEGDRVWTSPDGTGTVCPVDGEPDTADAIGNDPEDHAEWTRIFDAAGLTPDERENFMKCVVDEDGYGPSQFDRKLIRVCVKKGHLTLDVAYKLAGILRDQEASGSWESLLKDMGLKGTVIPKYIKAFGENKFNSTNFPCNREELGDMLERVQMKPGSKTKFLQYFGFF